MTRYLAQISFLMLSYPLIADDSIDLFKTLNTEDTLSFEWLEQRYTLNSSYSNSKYPVYPDVLRPEEHEIIIGLKVVKKDCRTVSCPIEVWIEYVRYLRFRKKPEFNLAMDPNWPKTPDHAIFPPSTYDTRYSFDDNRGVSILSEHFDSQPIVINEGLILNDDWYEKIRGRATDRTVLSDLDRFASLVKLTLSRTHNDKEHFELIDSYEDTSLLSRTYVRSDLGPRRTIITGTISHPIRQHVKIRSFAEGSTLRNWKADSIALDTSGQFEMEAILYKPKWVRVSQGFLDLLIYIEPGDSLHMALDGNAFYRNAKFSGDNASSNQVIVDFFHNMRGDTLMNITPDKSLYGTTQSEYLDRAKKKEQLELAFLQDHKNQLSPKFYNFFRQYIRLDNSTKIWNNTSRFFRNRDLKIDDELALECHQRGTLLYRLPEINDFSWFVSNYMEFRMSLLSWPYLGQSVGIRTPNNFALASDLLTAENAFRYGELLLFLSHGGINQDEDISRLARKLQDGARRRADKDIIEDYIDPSRRKKLRERYLQIEPHRFMGAGEKAYEWQYESKDQTCVYLRDYRGAPLILHIGIEQNAAAASADIREINAELEQPIKSFSIIETSDDSLLCQLTDRAIYVSANDMEELKRYYIIEDTGNKYYVIGADGIILFGGFRTNTFHKLRSAARSLASSDTRQSWQPTTEFWKNLGIGSFLILLLGSGFGLYRRSRRLKGERKRKLVELELKAIRSQMNPHFLFNALSSIQNLIRKKETDKADHYLSQFARLVRKILHNSEQSYITLAEEVEAIEEYCSLESLRHSFQYEIMIDPSIDHFNTYIPTMLIQPIVENAILHGLLSKEGHRQLNISIDPHSSGLTCTVIDNGIGINVSKSAFKKEYGHKSFGLSSVRHRLELLSIGHDDTQLTIVDLSEQDSSAIGTKVSLIIPTEQ